MVTRRRVNLFLASAFAAPFVIRQTNAATSPAAEDARTDFLRAQRDLAVRLLEQLADGAKGATPARKPPHNIAISPMSAAAALAIVAMGCDSAMQASIRQALQINGAALPADTFAHLLDRLNGIHGEAADAEPKFPLVHAERLVIDPQVRPAPAFLKGLEAYGIDVGIEDLAKAEALAKINDWVKDKTGGLIPAILDAPPGHGGLVALNALYFKDRWKSPFDVKLTAPRPFHSLDGKSDPIPLMRRDGKYSFAQKKGFVGVDLEFANDRFALVIATSTGAPASLADLMAGAGSWLGGEGFAEAEGEVALPRLEFSGTADLLAPLQALGLKSGAPLKLFGEKPPTISAIAQRTALKLNEEGAEAAAATAVVATRTLTTNFVSMVVDKPFVFALRDKTTGFLLMAGYIARPDVVKA